MLDKIKRKELDADLATLEVGEMNLSNYEKLMVLKLIRFMDDIERYADDDDEQPRKKSRHASYAPTSMAGSEFTEAVAGKDMDDVIQVMDELMDTLKTVNERAYASVMRKIKAL